MADLTTSHHDGGEAIETGRIETLIFVDVDGVLNVAVDAPGGNPVLLDRRNIHQALEIVKLGDQTDRSLAERLVSAYHRSPAGEDGEATYAQSIADSNTEFSHLLVSRLAEIIRSCGGPRKVVLSSNWRMFQYAKKLRELERTLSERLGETFKFDARTALMREAVPADRLRNIGNFVTAHCTAKVGPCPSALRVLVLDDFGATAASSWELGGRTVSSSADAEQYLRDRAPASTAVSACVVHTYDEWITPQGLPVSAGVGLTKQHLAQARAFLGAEAFEAQDVVTCDSGEEDCSYDIPRCGMKISTSSASLSTMPGRQTSESNGSLSSDEDSAVVCP